MADVGLWPRALKSDGEFLRITWADDSVTRVAFVALREACPCATCAEDRSRPPNPFRILSPKELTAGPLRPLKMEPVGHYAYQITWSDGHATGIYTLPALRELSVPVSEEV